jgi:hypothetical protein
MGIGGRILKEDAVLVVGMGIATGRVPPPERWVDELREEAELSALEGLI